MSKQRKGKRSVAQSTCQHEWDKDCGGGKCIYCGLKEGKEKGWSCHKCGFEGNCREVEKHRCPVKGGF